MKPFLFLIGVIAGIGGLLLSPQGFIGIAIAIFGAVSFFAGAIVGAVDDLKTVIQEQQKGSTPSAV